MPATNCCASTKNQQLTPKPRHGVGPGQQVKPHDGRTVEPHHPDDVTPHDAPRWRFLSMCLGSDDWLYCVLDIVIVRRADDLRVSRRHRYAFYAPSQIVVATQTAMKKTEKLLYCNNHLLSRTVQCSAQVFKRAGCHLKRAHLAR